MKAADRVVGLVLVALGLMLLVVLQTDVGGEAVVAMVGAVFLVAYAVTGAYGFLVPGGILTGLGVGVILETQGVGEPVVVLGLACGFLAIAAIDVLRRGRQAAPPWPLIPGGILALVALAEYEAAQGVLRWWPLVLTAFGVWLLVGRPRRPQSTQQREDRGATPPPPPLPPPPHTDPRESIDTTARTTELRHP